MSLGTDEFLSCGTDPLIMLQFFAQRYRDGRIAPSKRPGKVHKYLGMTLDYTFRGQVKITMFDYIEEILNAFYKAEPKGAGTKSSAAPENLFTVNEDCEKLQPDKTVAFHNLVAKTLYATKRARPDTCTAIAFLTSILDDESASTQQGRLDQAVPGPFDEIHQRHSHDAADSECQWKWHSEVVRGRTVCGTT
jgi:hypothetical protein